MNDDDAPAGFLPLPIGGEFSRTNGPFFEREEGGVYQLGFRVAARHTNSRGICHGGMLATLGDMLLPLTAFHRSERLHGHFLPTVSLQLDYLGPALLGAWVQGEAQVLRTTRTLIFLQGLATADGEPALRVSGVFRIGAARAPAGAR